MWWQLGWGTTEGPDGLSPAGHAITSLALVMIPVEKLSGHEIPEAGDCGQWGPRPVGLGVLLICLDSSLLRQSPGASSQVLV